MHILADIGGTKTRIAGARDASGFGEPIILDTPKTYEDGIKVISAAAKKIAGDQAIESMIAGVRGSVTHEKGTMWDTGPLSGWAGRSIAQDFGLALSASSVYLENDTALVGLGEAVYGAGKGAAIAAYITVSTGVNGIRIIDGRLDRSMQGFEIGGQYLSLDATQTLESMISGRSVSERFGMNPRELGKDHPVWQELAKVTAYGVHNTMLHWSPERVIFGGAMFNEVGIPVESVAAEVKAIMKKFHTVPEMVHSSLGDVGGLWGGLAILNQRA